MDFFFDTGIFLGICDPSDTHSEACRNFFNKYPQPPNNYYTTKKVQKELENKMFKRRRRGSSYSASRLIEQCIKLQLRRIKEIVRYEDIHNDFNALVKAVASTVNYNYPDACIVANALIWSYDLNLDKPTFITVDYQDIAKNAEKIIKEAELRIYEVVIPLEIKAIWDM